MAPTPLAMCRGQGGALLFSADASGDSDKDGKGTWADHTTDRCLDRDAE